MSETSFYRCKLSVVGFVGAKGADIIGEISAGAGNFCVLHDVVGIKELADSYKPEWWRSSSSSGCTQVLSLS